MIKEKLIKERKKKISLNRMLPNILKSAKVIISVKKKEKSKLKMKSGNASQNYWM